MICYINVDGVQNTPRQNIGIKKEKKIAEAIKSLLLRPSVLPSINHILVPILHLPPVLQTGLTL